MTDAIESFAVDDMTIAIYYDENPLDPREDENAGVMVCWHRRYDLGDRQPDTDEQDCLTRGGFPLLARYLRRYKGMTGDLVKLGLYDHSGITMYANGGAHAFDSAGWDSGTVGFIYTTSLRVRELGIVEVESCLLAEIDEYDRYLTGQACGYVITDEVGDVLDSCWGFNDLDDARSEAQAAATGITVPV